MKHREFIKLLQDLGFSVYSEESALIADKCGYKIYLKSKIASNRVYKCNIIGILNINIFYGEIETIDEFKTIWKCLQ